MNAPTTTKPYEVLGSVDDVDWLDKRNLGIGSSDAAAMLDESPWRSAFGLWAEKSGRIEPDDLESHERIFWGRELEAAILKGYEKRTGRPVRPAGQLLRSTVHPWAQCTLDGETKVTPDAAWTILEVKNTNEFMGDAWDGGAPEHYRIQAHHQMLVTGASMATIAVLIGGQALAWEDIERDEVLIRRLIHVGERFWERVQNGDPPPVAPTKQAAQDLGRVYPRDTGEVIALPDDLDLVAARVMDLRAQRSVVAKELQAAENALKAAMKDATEGHLRSGTTVTLKTQDRKGYWAKPSSSRVLRVKAAS